MLILQRKKGQSIMINDDIVLTITDIGNDQVKVAIEAPRSIPIIRGELLEATRMNKEAACVSEAFLSSLSPTMVEKKDSK